MANFAFTSNTGQAPGGGTFVPDTSPGAYNVLVSDPSSQPQGGAPTSNGSAGAAVASAPTIDPQTQQAINNIQAAINRIPTQQNAADTQLQNQYNNALQTLLAGKQQGQINYNQGTQTNATNYVGNKNTIGSQAGSALNSLLRLLGSRGASGSAADAARGAVARGATLQRSDAANTFGTNQQGLDTGWNTYLNQYNANVGNVGAQRDKGISDIANSFTNNKASLLQTLATLQNSPSSAQPYLDQANSLINSAASYVSPDINYNPQAYTPSSISSYTATPQSASLAGNNSGGDYFSPYLSALLGKKQTATV